MPTISELPQAAPVGAADLVPVSQSGTTAATTVGNLLAGVQPAILAPTGSLLGRNSLGTGGPEAVSVGSGLGLNAGTLSAIGITGLTETGTIAAADLVGISQGGADRNIPYAAFLDGMTIDLAQPAAPATDSDTLWVAQGTSTMLRQTFAAIWSWLVTKLPSYKRPVAEITTNTTLDGTMHNGAVLVCSQAVTLSSGIHQHGQRVLLRRHQPEQWRGHICIRDNHVHRERDITTWAVGDVALRQLFRWRRGLCGPLGQHAGCSGSGNRSGSKRSHVQHDDTVVERANHRGGTHQLYGAIQGDGDHQLDDRKRSDQRDYLHAHWSCSWYQL